MPEYFLESSAFCKRYKRECGTDFIISLFSGNNDLFYLNLAILEIRKMLYRLRFNPLPTDRQISEEELGSLLTRFSADLSSMRRIVFTNEMIQKASYVLSQGHLLKSSFDLAQLAAFLVAKEEYPKLQFVCSDIRSKLVEVAKQLTIESDVLVPEIVN